jgi:nickel transport protein
MMRRLGILAVAIVAALALPTVAAEAHRLRLFATVEDGVVHGYGFFVGGGRPSEAQLVIRNGTGSELFRGPTGPDGSFSFRPAVASDLTLIIDAGDGHVADTHLPADRFAAGHANGAVAAAPTRGGPPAAGAASSAQASPAPPSPDDLAALIDRSVDRAVSRQLAPLLEAYAQAEGRARFTDVISGIAMIIGLAGLALWARSRQRPVDKVPTRRGWP